MADKIVDGWWCKFGIPETILIDGGKKYQSKLMELIYKYLDVRAFKTTAFYPNGNPSQNFGETNQYQPNTRSVTIPRAIRKDNVRKSP